MIHVSAAHGVVGVPVRPDLVNLFPAAPRVTFEGDELLLVPHGSEETRLLRNLGLDVPAPILSHYDWAGGTPFDVQKLTCAMLTTNPRAFVLNGMGTGKTKAALWAWHYLYQRGEADRLLVVAPLSTLNFTWAREVFTTLPGMRVAVLHGTRAKRLERLADPTVDIFVINHDGLGVVAEEVAAQGRIDTLVLDELSAYRNGSALRTKIARGLASKMKWVWGMTGSPTPNAPTDAWGQCTVVNPSRVPKYFGRFRDEVMHKVTQFKFVPKPDALDRVHAVMQPAVRFTIDDVVELPEVVERVVEVELGAKQSAVYRQMEAQAYAAIEAEEITAMNAGAVLNKLLQISCGYVYTRDGETVPLDNAARIEALLDIVAATDRKVLVFVPFKHALKGIAEALAKDRIEHAVVSGDTPNGERGDIFAAFQQSSKYKVIAAHPATMSHGLTLTAADTVVWFGPTTSLETFEQANARIRRYGQKHKQQIIMLQGTPVEKRMYARLRAKQKIQDALLEMFKD